MNTALFQALLPAIVTIMVAFFSHRVVWALFSGIVTGAIVISQYQIIKSFAGTNQR